MKKLFIIVPVMLVLCSATGCQDRAAIAELEALKAQAETEKQNVALVRRGIEEFNRGNLEVFRELHAPDYRYYFPSGTTEPLSREENIKRMAEILAAAPDSNYSIEESIAAGDKVIVRLAYSGTHEGEYQGIPPTGNRVSLSAISISRIENGKVVEARGEYDQLGLMMQLGMELKPKGRGVPKITPPSLPTK